MQQVKYMLADRVHNPDLRSQILENWSELILKKGEEGCKIILMMDANENTGPETNITKFITRNSLEDVHTYIMTRKPETSRAGSRQVLDIALCTQGALPYIKMGGLCALDIGLTSNHVLLWFDFDTKSFFGGIVPHCVPPQHREFSF